MTPEPLDPYVFRARLGRVAEGGAALLHFDRGWGDWKIASKWPGGPDAKYPQGRYRLNGISAKAPLSTEAREVLTSLAGQGELLAKTTKIRQKFLVDLYVRIPGADSEPMRVSEARLERLAASPDAEVRALAEEVRWARRALQSGNATHLNQALLDRGLAEPHKAGT